MAWLLSATATLLVLVAWGVAWWIGTQWEQGMAEADAANHLSRAVFGAQLLQFAATITGLVTLCLIPIMVRLRNVPAPRRLVWATTVIGMAPVMIQLLRAYGN